MKKELIIRSNSSAVDFALLKDGKLIELSKEVENNKFSVGDIFFAKIRKLIPGLNASFVSVGHKKDGFLHYHDLGPKLPSLLKFIKQITTGKHKDYLLKRFKFESDISKDYVFQDIDTDIIKEVQEDFPLTSKPFTEIANKIGLDCNELISHLKDLKSHGIMRRVAAILHHRKAGFRANAMGVWDVPIDQIEEIAPKMAAFKSVSHCYRRPTYPDWPYSLFTMIHGRSAKDCNDLLKKLSDISGITKYDALYSSKEYKKTRLKYFSKEYLDWETKYKRAI